jgi:hypothetical protein
VRLYADTFDPFVALSAAAAVSSRIKLGTGACLVIEMASHGADPGTRINTAGCRPQCVV